MPDRLECWRSLELTTKSDLRLDFETEHEVVDFVLTINEVRNKLLTDKLPESRKHILAQILASKLRYIAGKQL